MSTMVFLNRRSGYDRRLLDYGNSGDRRIIDRRKSIDNGYLLVVGNTGLDRFNLFVTMPLVSVLMLSFLANYLNTLF